MSCKRIFVALAVLVVLQACNGSDDKADLDVPPVQQVTPEKALKLALAKYSQTARQLSPEQGYPRNTENNQWQQIDWQDWTNGFFAGVLWNLSLLEPDLRDSAMKWTLPLTDHLTLQGHDLGFIFNNSFGKAYQLTADSQYLDTLEVAAANLASRFNANVGAIRSWDFGNYSYPVIIDNLMNLELLFNVSQIANDDQYFNIALQHAMTSADNHLRGDGSTFHLVDFDPQSGLVLSRQTVQGAADDSAWARGQAWAIYGFSTIYRETGNQEFLDVAQRVADYYIANLPDDFVPYWDFSLSEAGEPRDSSAAAIAAAGLWLLAASVDNESGSQHYRQLSEQTVASLITPEYFDKSGQSPALLRHATGNKPSDREVDTSLIYADYYLIEALLLQQGVLPLSD